MAQYIWQFFNPGKDLNQYWTQTLFFYHEFIKSIGIGSKFDFTPIYRKYFITKSVVKYVLTIGTRSYIDYF